MIIDTKKVERMLKTISLEAISNRTGISINTLIKYSTSNKENSRRWISENALKLGELANQYTADDLKNKLMYGILIENQPLDSVDWYDTKEEFKEAVKWYPYDNDLKYTSVVAYEDSQKIKEWISLIPNGDTYETGNDIIDSRQRSGFEPGKNEIYAYVIAAVPQEGRPIEHAIGYAHTRREALAKIDRFETDEAFMKNYQEIYPPAPTILPKEMYERYLKAGLFE